MNKKRLLLVSIGLLGILVVLAAAGFILTSNSSAQSNQTLSESPASLSGSQAASEQSVSQPSANEQAAIEYEAKYEAYFNETKDSASKYEGYSSQGYGCSHDSQSFDWSMED